MADPQNLREVIKEEYKKCLENPIYFMKKYVKIAHPQKGRIDFDLFPFQEKALSSFVENDFNIILKSRQLGITTLVAAYSLWMMIFNSDKNILCISIKQETAKEIVTKVRYANDGLPSWLKVQCVEDNRLSLKLKNGSQIKAVSSSGDAGRSSSLSLLIIDEAAFIDSIEDIWLSAQSTLSTGGKAIILSTPNGVGNFFHRMWMKSESGENNFKTIKLPWHLHPERTQKWRDEQTDVLGERGAAQECDCDFATSGNTVITTDTLTWYFKLIKEPIEKRWADQSLWLWEHPNPNKQYLVCADVARGDGSDKSAFHILDLESMNQVAEYQGFIDTKTYGQMLVSIATEYNKSLLVVENNNIGWATLQEVIDSQYQNTFYSSPDLTYVDTDKQLVGKINRYEKNLIPGFTTTSKTRPLIISKLESYFKDHSFILNSNRLWSELSVFIWNGPKAKPEAMTGFNDDLVTSLGMGLWVRDTALRLKNESGELNKAMINSIHRTEPNVLYTSAAAQKGGNTWRMPVGKTQEDLKWLL